MAGTLVRLCDASAVTPDRPLRVERDGYAYAVFQVGGQYHVTADECSHGPGLLSEGYVEGCEIECPFHGGRFDLRTGEPTAPPCFEPINVWDVTLIDGGICIDPMRPR